jgi:N-acylneuraminate cytidylyltransferase
MIVAIIPARGGSKRIPGKNIKPFFGKPLLAYPIAAALATGLFDAVVVSTDDPAIAAVAREWGAQTPFSRPAELADDHTPTQPVLDHAVEWLAANREPVTRYCALYANPFTTAATIARGYRMLEATPEALVVMGVTDFGYPIQRALRRDAAGKLSYMHPEHAATRSQDLPPAWHDAAQFYWHDLPRIAAARQRGEPVLAHALPIPRHLCQDIDTPEDWDVAERLFAAFFKESR